jgi:hypothetical protein
MTYIKQYNQQKVNAKHRNIEWQFTYDEWIEWWGEDIEKRGKKKGSLCMARKGDEGPYHPDNCYKSLFEKNTFDAHYGKLKGPQPKELVERRAAMTRGKPNLKIKEALTGRTLSEERKLKISESMKAYRQKLREAAQ